MRGREDAVQVALGADARDTAVANGCWRGPSLRRPVARWGSPDRARRHRPAAFARAGRHSPPHRCRPSISVSRLCRRHHRRVGDAHRGGPPAAAASSAGGRGLGDGGRTSVAAARSGRGRRCSWSRQGSPWCCWWRPACSSAASRNCAGSTSESALTAWSPRASTRASTTVTVRRAGWKTSWRPSAPALA